MTTASNSDARKRLAARNTAPDTTGRREQPRCSCGPHAIVMGAVPDPGCPFHGSHTTPDPTPEPDIRCGNCDCQMGCEGVPEPDADCDYDCTTHGACTVHNPPRHREPDATVSDHATLTDGPCTDCGCRYPAWWIDHDVWNATLAGPDQKDDPGGMLCPNCFLAKTEPIRGAWHLTFPAREATRVAEAVKQERAEACELETLWGAALERAILAERHLERERAARLALVAKIEALCDVAERNSDTYKRSCIVTTGKVRDALLDDTKATS